MSISPDIDHFAPGVRTRSCAACGRARLETIAELPDLPLTALFTPERPVSHVPGYDQALLYCAACGHGQLAQQLPPAMLYDSTYGFRTSASGTARRGTDWFLAQVAELAPRRRFRCVLDVGCNDFYLLSQLGDRADRRIGVDPLWADARPETLTPGIEVIGAPIEAVDLAALGERPDLVVCRHTLEHIAQPATLLARLLDIVADDGLLVFEVPGFDALVSRLRFDQVFHQHYHYYSLSSFTRLVSDAGGHYLAHRYNYHDWGAMLVALRKGVGDQLPPHPERNAGELRCRYDLFRQHMAAAGEAIELLPAPLFGYGAAQMLPVLAWHLGTDLSNLTAVIDDDPAKEGWWYANLPLRILGPGAVADWSAASVVITAVDNVQPILGRLMAQRPRHLLYPLPLM